MLKTLIYLHISEISYIFVEPKARGSSVWAVTKKLHYHP